MASFIDNIIVGIKKEEEYDKVVEKVVFDSNTAAQSYKVTYFLLNTTTKVYDIYTIDL